MIRHMWLCVLYISVTPQPLSTLVICITPPIRPAYTDQLFSGRFSHRLLASQRIKFPIQQIQSMQGLALVTLTVHFKGKKWKMKTMCIV